MNLIGILGQARSGKDTVAAWLRQGLDDFQHPAEPRWSIVPMAKPLKDAVSALFGFTADQLYGDLKEVIDPHWGVTPRWVMQFVGTELLRDRLGEALRQAEAKRGLFSDFHLCSPNGPIEQARRGARVIIPDIRFQNEVAAVRSLGGVLVRVIRPGAGAAGGIAGHASEAGNDLHADYLISNTGSLDDLRQKVEDLAQALATI